MGKYVTSEDDPRIRRRVAVAAMKVGSHRSSSFQRCQRDFFFLSSSAFALAALAIPLGVAAFAASSSAFHRLRSLAIFWALWRLPIAWLNLSKLVRRLENVENAITSSNRTTIKMIISKPSEGGWRCSPLRG